MSKRQKKTDETSEAPAETTPEVAAETVTEAAAETTPAAPAEPDRTSRVWVCPGAPRCRARWVGAEGSNGHRAYKAHIARHAHAKGPHPSYNPATVVADDVRRDRMV